VDAPLACRQADALSLRRVWWLLGDGWQFEARADSGET